MKKQHTSLVSTIADKFNVTIYTHEGEPCLAFGTYEKLGKIQKYVEENHGKELLDLFNMVTQHR
jgi:hypothetical protein